MQIAEDAEGAELRAATKPEPIESQGGNHALHQPECTALRELQIFEAKDYLVQHAPERS